MLNMYQNSLKPWSQGHVALAESNPSCSTKNFKIKNAIRRFYLPSILTRNDFKKMVEEASDDQLYLSIFHLYAYCNVHKIGVALLRHLATHRINCLRRSCHFDMIQV